MRFLAVLSVAVLLHGCAWLNNNTNINGALPIVPSFDSAARVDLPAALTGLDLRGTDGSKAVPKPAAQSEPEKLLSSCAGSGKQNNSANQDTPENQNDRRCLVAALYYFHTVNKSDDQRKFARNRIQEQLIGASALACSQFKQHLNSFQAHGNFVLGSIATLLAGAGAITTHEQTARTLAGASAITSGVRAEFNGDYFYQNAATVITKAIDNQRNDYIRNLREVKQKQAYADYSVEAAIADAYTLNDICSLVKGFEGANVALNIVENPGLKFISKSLADANAKPTTGGIFLQLGAPPGVPLNVTAQPTGTPGEIAVSFDPPASAGDGGIVAFRVMAVPSAGTDSDAASPLKTRHVLRGLMSGTSYTFTVVAAGTTGNSPPSEPSAPVAAK